MVSAAPGPFPGYSTEIKATRERAEDFAQIRRGESVKAGQRTETAHLTGLSDTFLPSFMQLEFKYFGRLLLFLLPFPLFCAVLGLLWAQQ